MGEKEKNNREEKLGEYTISIICSKNSKMLLIDNGK
jgi:hypothetical protein